MKSFIARLHRPDLGLLFIRLAVGIVFTHAGWLKVSNMEAALGFFGSLGVPSFLTYIVAYAEFLGGIALILGVFVAYAAILHAIIMIVALFRVHLPNGYGLQGNGYEYVLLLLLASLAILTLGAGRYVIGRRRSSSVPTA